MFLSPWKLHLTAQSHTMFEPLQILPHKRHNLSKRSHPELKLELPKLTELAFSFYYDYIIILSFRSRQHAEIERQEQTTLNLDAFGMLGKLTFSSLMLYVHPSRNVEM